MKLPSLMGLLFLAMVFCGCEDECGRTKIPPGPGWTSIFNMSSVEMDESPVPDGCMDECGNVVPQATQYKDADGDGYGSHSDSYVGCQKSGYVPNDLDCNDNDATINPAAASEECGYQDKNCDGMTYYDAWYNCGDPVDNDSDGVKQDKDCNDDDKSVYPGATEICDKVDNDCDMIVDEGVPTYEDGDGDGWGDRPISDTVCQLSKGYVTRNGDCDDADDAVHPSADEVCDSKDNDCDGITDEGGTTTWYKDADGDKYGDVSTAVSAHCAPAANYVTFAGDCNDTDPSIHPSADEICDKKDNDCDTQIDEGLDYDNDGYTSCQGDCDNLNASVKPGATELCDGKDNDCDEQTDEGVDKPIYPDADGDGYGTTTGATRGCLAGNGYVLISGDCNDEDPTIHNGATELCDTKDNDCDTIVDENVASITWYKDVDTDGFGVATDTLNDCTAPAGYVSLPGDCDDENKLVYPGAQEVCDSIDNDCDSQTDEGFDGDGDGYSSCGGDCDDTNGAIKPGATELCDSKDNDCNGGADDTLEFAQYYRDGDGDGYGVDADQKYECTAQTGYATQNGDCDDTKAAVNPGAAEVCDNADNNCSGTTDEGLVTFTYYQDSDKDGWGNPEVSVEACAQPSNYVGVAGDCDDTLTTGECLMGHVVSVISSSTADGYEDRAVLDEDTDTAWAWEVLPTSEVPQWLLFRLDTSEVVTRGVITVFTTDSDDIDTWSVAFGSATGCDTETPTFTALKSLNTSFFEGSEVSLTPSVSSTGNCFGVRWTSATVTGGLYELELQ